MDANLLLECFSATLQTDQNVRLQAEMKLRELAITPGFLGGCLDIISSENTAISDGVKQAAAVYFKNRIVRFWNYDNPNSIDNDERPVVKERVLQVIINSKYKTKQQLIPVLRTLISYDFPKKWDTLLNETGHLLQQVPSGVIKDDDLSQLYTGLLCFTEITRKFRWVNNQDRSKELDPMISQVFPHLLNIGNSIIAASDSITEFSSEILKLILKVYKFVTYYDLPDQLQARESVSAWGEFHIAIINLPPPIYILKSNISEQEKSFLEISKCYKWSIANIYRLFTRYASSSLSKKYQYPEFHNMFIQEFIPHIIPNYLSIIEKWCSNERWLSSSSLYYMLQFLSHCVSQKSTWLLIKPYFESLVSHLIYPLLCPTEQALESFENDPQEYIHSNFDIYDEFDSPDIAALGLLVTFVDKRKKTTLEPIITFAYNQLTKLNEEPETLEVAKKKDGALRLIGGVSHYVVIRSSVYYSQMEKFLANLVFPNLNSKYDFLKARTLEIASKFADLEYKSDETLSMLFHGILNNFNISENEDISLPVCLQCALAIQAYLPMPQFREILSTIILPTMSKLLDLSNEIDIDVVSMVMQECVENFSEQLQPFGVDLMIKLVEQFMRLATEINEASKVEIDDFDGDFDDQSEKVMAATGLLNTMITVLLSFENSKEICIKLEEVFSPAIEFVLKNKLDDFLTEIGELIENSTFLLRSISPSMWMHFHLLYESFSDGIALMYVEELIQCLQNYLIYGKEELANNPQLMQNFYDIFIAIIEGDDNQIGLNDITYGCELAQTFILSLEDKAAPYTSSIVKSVLEVFRNADMDKHHVKNTSFNVNVNNVIVSSLIYHAPSTLILLQECQGLAPFFDRWFKLIPNLSRVYDLKLSTLGLIGLVGNNEVISSLDQSIIQAIGPSFAAIMSVLPKSMEKLETKRKDFNEAGFSGQPHEDEYENAEDEEFDEFSDKKAEEYTGEYLEFLQQENSKLKDVGFFDEDDEEVFEDPLATTPLDNVNVLSFFKEFLESLQSSDVNKYVVLFGSLHQSEQQAMIDAFKILQ